MELNLLNYFLEIVKAGNFSLAADSLYMNQSTLSKQIKKLERELGVLLFDRSHRTPVLTKEGLALSKEAPKLLAQYQNLLKAVIPNSRHLHIGILPVMCHYGLSDFITAFRDSYPDIMLTLEELDNAQMEEALSSRRCELAFLRLNAKEEPNASLKILPLFHDELALIVPASHPLSHRTHVSLQEFKNDSFIFLSKDTSLYDSSIKACIQAGFEPNILYMGASGESMVQSAIQTNSVAMFMRKIALDLQNPDLSILSFDETVETIIALAALKDEPLSYSAKLFWNMLKSKKTAG